MLDGAIITVLLLISFQDLRSRSVYWFWFPILLGLFLSADILEEHRSFSAIGQTSVVNCIFLVLQFLLLSLYFSVKNRRWVNIMTDLLGWGDVLLLLCIAFYLPVLNFLFFYIASLVVVLVIWFFWQVVSKGENKHIPLAGLQAMMFGLFLLACRFLLHGNVADDTWVLNLIHKWI